jgi:RNA polymerase sigma factor (TIGR02999 family)
MDGSTESGITLLLHAWADGDSHALDKLTPLVYEQLDRLAHFYMAREKNGHLLQDTALINETYLRLSKLRDLDWRDRRHFYLVCARLMQNILIDYARSELQKKRGGDAQRVPLDERLIDSRYLSGELIALDDALKRLAATDERKAKVVQLRFFAGLSVEETAEVLGVSKRTVNEEWKFAKAWLFHELGKGNRHGA